MSRPRIALAKTGLDGHDRGIKVIAMALRDAGAEVIYLGMRRTATEVIDAAVDEDVDAIGLSILSGSHLALAREVLEERRSQNAEDIPLVVGGTISPEDSETLVAMGVAAVFPVGSALDEVVSELLTISSRKASA